MNPCLSGRFWNEMDPAALLVTPTSGLYLATTHLIPLVFDKRTNSFKFGQTLTIQTNNVMSLFCRLTHEWLNSEKIGTLSHAPVVLAKPRQGAC